MSRAGAHIAADRAGPPKPVVGPAAHRPRHRITPPAPRPYAACTARLRPSPPAAATDVAGKLTPPPGLAPPETATGSLRARAPVEELDADGRSGAIEDL